MHGFFVQLPIFINAICYRKLLYIGYNANALLWPAPGAGPDSHPMKETAETSVPTASPEFFLRFLFSFRSAPGKSLQAPDGAPPSLVSIPAHRPSPRTRTGRTPQRSTAAPESAGPAGLHLCRAFPSPSHRPLCETSRRVSFLFFSCFTRGRQHSLMYSLLRSQTRPITDTFVSICALSKSSSILSRSSSGTLARSPPDVCGSCRRSR